MFAICNVPKLRQNIALVAFWRVSPNRKRNENQVDKISKTLQVLDNNTSYRILLITLKIYT